MSTRSKSGRNPKAKFHPPISPKRGGKIARKSSGFTVKSLKPGALFKPAGMSRKFAGISIKLFSRLTGFSERAIAGWESGEPMSESARRRLLEVERFRKRLAEVVKPELIPAWLDTPNKAFDGLKPIEVIERGEVDRLWNMIFYLESGIAS